MKWEVSQTGRQKQNRKKRTEQELWRRVDKVEPATNKYCMPLCLSVFVSQKEKMHSLVMLLCGTCVLLV